MSDKFVPLCPAGDLVEGTARRFDVGGRPVVVVRLADGLRALGDTCSHDDYSLAEGEVDTDECTIECWKHGSLFDLDTGSAVTLPATRPVPTFEAAEIDGQVCVAVEEQS